MSQRLTALAMATITAAAIAVSVYLAFGTPAETTSGASAYSRSAIGHDGLVALLNSQGIPASVSRGGSAGRVRQGGLLVLAEPDFDPGSGRLLKTLLRSRNVLLVLPKWSGNADRDSKGWLSFVAPQPLPLPQAVLDDALDGETVIRQDGPVGPGINLIGPAPHPHAPVQLIQSRQLQPELDEKGAILIGSLRRAHGTLWVLSDPDIISNHGLAHGNAALAVALMQKARNGGPVIFDETIHGFSASSSGQLRLLVARPFAAATVDALLACALLLWAGLRGFGAAAPRPAPLRAGKLALIGNIADLLVVAGHQGDMLRRYVQVTIEDVAARLHAPDGAEGPARAAFLAQMQAQRGIALDAAALSGEAARLAALRRPPPGALFALATQIHSWKQEMLHGSTGLERHRGRDTQRNPQGGGGPGRRDRVAAGEPAGGRPRAA